METTCDGRYIVVDEGDDGVVMFKPPVRNSIATVGTAVGPQSDIPAASRPVEVVSMVSGLNVPLHSSQVKNRGIHFGGKNRAGRNRSLQKAAPKAKRQRNSLLVVEQLTSHRPEYYTAWEKFYLCIYEEKERPESVAKNGKPSESNPARVFFTKGIHTFDTRTCRTRVELRYFDIGTCFDYHIKISTDLLVKALAHLHPFTAVGLHAEALGYSFGRNGVINYLCIPRQVNRVEGVWPDFEDWTDPADAFSVASHGIDRCYFYDRCWIHVVPNGPPCLSLVDLYFLFKQDPGFLAIVISPRRKCLKALCAVLTDNGRRVIQECVEQQKREGSNDICKLIELRSKSEKFCLTADFELVSDKCEYVVDQRLSTTIAQQIEEHLRKMKRPKIWTTELLLKK